LEDLKKPEADSSPTLRIGYTGSNTGFIIGLIGGPVTGGGIQVGI